MIELLIHEIEKDRETVLNFIKDNTPLKKGIYLKIDIDKPFDAESFKDFIVVNNKTSNPSEFQCSLDLVEREKLISYILERDLVSGLLNDDANKTIDGGGKKILSTTYQTLSIKNEFTDYTKKDSKFKSSEEFCEVICRNGLDSFRNIGEKIKVSLELKKLKYVNETLEKEIEYTTSEERLSQISLIEDYLKNNFNKIILFKETQDISQDSKIKLFFYSKSGKISDSMADYEREYSYYLNNYIFNKGTISIVEGKLKGSITYGFNNNDAKPYIKPTRMNISFVKMHSLEDALNTKFAFDLLKLISDNRSAKLFGFNNLDKDNQFLCNLDELIKTSNDRKSMYYKLHYKDKYVEEYDLIAEKSTFNAMVYKDSIKCKNFLKADLPFSKKDAEGKESIDDIYRVKDLLAMILFCGNEHFNKYDDYYMFGINSNDAGNKLLENRNAVIFSKYKYLLHDFLTSTKPSEELINTIINKYTSEAINSYFTSMHSAKYFDINARLVLNIKLNLLNKYIGENKLMNTLNKMNEKLMLLKNENAKLSIESDSEYYFLLGQLSYYIESRCKGDIDFGIFKFYTEKRDPKYIKKYLIQRFELVSYDFSLMNSTFKAILEETLKYTPTSNINEHREEFYIGVCSDNIFYKSKENTEK